MNKLIQQLNGKNINDFLEKNGIEIRKKGNWRKWWHAIPVRGVMTLFWIMWGITLIPHYLSFKKLSLFDADPKNYSMGIGKTVYKAQKYNGIDLTNEKKNTYEFTYLIHELDHIYAQNESDSFKLDYFIRPWPVCDSYRAAIEFRAYGNQIIKMMNQGFRKKDIDNQIEMRSKQITSGKYFWPVTDKKKVKLAFKRLIKRHQTKGVTDVRYEMDVFVPAGPVPNWMEKRT